MNCQRQRQSSEGEGGGNVLLYSAKLALKEATSVTTHPETIHELPK